MNKTAEYKFTIVVPVYNETDGLEALEKSLSDYLPKCRYKACVLFVDDGSDDGSIDKIREICDRRDDFYYISLGHAGVTAAMKAGFDAVESELIGYIDADLQTVPEDFETLFDGMGTNALMVGIRADRHDTFSKRLQSKIGNAFRNSLTHDGAKDSVCPLKVIRTDVAKKLPMFGGLHRFLPALVLLQEGCTYGQLPVRHYQRVTGKSKFSMWNRLPGFFDCFAVWWMRRRYLNFKVRSGNIE